MCVRFTHTAYLPLPQLSLSACRVHILPVMKDFCLISFGKLCDDRFSFNFNTNNVFLKKGNDFLTAYRDATPGIYLIYYDKPQPLPPISNHSIPPPPTPSPSLYNTLANSMHKMSTKRDLFLYLHQATCSPFPSTWIQYIDAGFMQRGQD